MADYNWGMQSDVGGYLGENNKPDMSTDNAHQDKEGNNDAQRTGGTFQDTPEPLTDNGDTDRGVGGEQLHLTVIECIPVGIRSGCRVKSRFRYEGPRIGHRSSSD